jgi:hypothetical protein
MKTIQIAEKAGGFRRFIIQYQELTLFPPISEGYSQRLDEFPTRWKGTGKGNFGHGAGEAADCRG